MMNKENLEKLAHNLDLLTRLVAGHLLKDAGSKIEKVRILYELGIPTKDIALLAGTTEGSVETMKKRLRKRDKADDKTKGGKESAED